MKPGTIWVAGKEHSVDVEVAESGVPIASRAMRWLPPDKGAYAASGPATCICLHDKGAEGTATQTYAFLKQKGLGVHASIDADGSFTQYADPATTRTYHAGKINDFSVGIEIANSMFPDLRKRKPGEKWVAFLERMNVAARPIVRRPYRGWNQPVYGHFDVQIESVVKVVTALCGALDIPRRVLVDSKGRPWGGLLPGLTTSPLDKKKVVGTIAPEYRRGVVAHLHATNGHVDPASDVFLALVASGFEATVVA